MMGYTVRPQRYDDLVSENHLLYSNSVTSLWQRIIIYMIKHAISMGVPCTRWPRSLVQQVGTCQGSWWYCPCCAAGSRNSWLRMARVSLRRQHDRADAGAWPRAGFACHQPWQSSGFSRQGCIKKKYVSAIVTRSTSAAPQVALKLRGSVQGRQTHW